MNIKLKKIIKKHLKLGQGWAYTLKVAGTNRYIHLQYCSKCKIVYKNLFVDDGKMDFYKFCNERLHEKHRC